MRPFPKMPALLMLAVTLGVSSAATPTEAQSSTMPDWQTAAGGKMAFDVASVKVSVDSEKQQANFPLDNRDTYSPNGGLLTIKKFPLSTIIGFAYKLPDYQTGLVRARLPKALAAERFDIEARAPGNPTKDQMRLMMRSLLADRFKLAAHFETRLLPIYDLVLDKPGKLGPQLTPSADGPCVTTAPKDGWFQPCGGFGFQIISGRWHMGARDLSAQEIAIYLDELAPGGTLGRAVLDHTGLSGLYDLRMEFTPEASTLPPGMESDQDAPPLATALVSVYPLIVEAMKGQLGLKLVPSTGPVDVLVIDHIEEPSGN